MLDDKKLLQLIRYIEEKHYRNYLVSTNLIAKIKQYGYELFTNDKLLTKAEKDIFDNAVKAIEKGNNQ